MGVPEDLAGVAAHVVGEAGLPVGGRAFRNLVLEAHGAGASLLVIPAGQARPRVLRPADRRRRRHPPSFRRLLDAACRPRSCARTGGLVERVRGAGPGVERREPALVRADARGARGADPPGLMTTGPGTRAATLVASQPARSERMDRLLLLDGNGLIYRGYFALIDQPLTTSKGELVTAVFGFTNIVLRAIQDAKPDLIAVAFDLPAPTFRHDRYAEYKATRTRMPDDMRDQIPKVREVVKVLGIPIYQQEGFEADDVDRDARGPGRGRGFETVILTGDLDMLQLVSDNTRLMVSLRGGVANTVSYDLAKVDERWGLRARPDARLQGPQGRPDGQHPGHPGGGGEDGVEADPDVGDARRALPAHRRGHAGEAARAAGGAPRVRAGEPRADAAGAGRRRAAGPAARPRGGVRPRGRRPAVPRVRVPDADRPAAAARRRATRGRDRGDARAPRGRVPGGAGAASGGGGGAGAAGVAGGTRAGGQLQLSLDFDVVSGGPGGGVGSASAAAPASRCGRGHARAAGGGDQRGRRRPARRARRGDRGPGPDRGGRRGGRRGARAVAPRPGGGGDGARRGRPAAARRA